MRKKELNKKKKSLAELVKPNDDRVFIKKIDRQTQTESGLYLVVNPAHAKVENIGVIVAIGSNIKAKEYCKVGVKVSFDNVLEENMTIDGEDYVILAEKNIFCFFYDTEE